MRIGRASGMATRGRGRGRRRRHGREASCCTRGFSLLEMLVVLAIVAALVVFAVPALTSLVRGTELRQAADLVTGELAAARSTALRDNRVVAFRFYRIDDRSRGAVRRPVFEAFQAGFLDAGPPGSRGGPVFQPIGPVRRLPDGTLVIEDRRYSTLVTDPDRRVRMAPDEAPALKALDPECRQFAFLPDGTTNLDPGSPDGWCLTLAEEKAAVLAADGLPPNFVTIQIDPVTGNLTSHLPR